MNELKFVMQKYRPSVFLKCVKAAILSDIGDKINIKTCRNMKLIIWPASREKGPSVLFKILIRWSTNRLVSQPSVL